MTIPISDISIPEARAMFESNVWGPIAITQAFLPLLLASKGTVVNNTSIAACVTSPCGGAYSASKAALAILTDTLRLELEVFGINVVDLRTGVVGPTNLLKNKSFFKESTAPILPKGSVYEPARDAMENVIRREAVLGAGMLPAVWARAVVRDLKRPNPPFVIWRGKNALISRIGGFLPRGLTDWLVKKMTRYNRVEEIMKIALE